MADQPTRQELYDRLRHASKDEVVLEEMIRLGFWSARGELPHDPADEIRRRGELQRLLDALRTEQSRLHNVEALRRELRKRRFEASRLKRQETRERRLRERAERAQAWRQQQQRAIAYLGEGVSGGLNHQQSEVARLEGQGLPVLHAAPELAAAMGISLGMLRFLSFSRRTSTLTHYRRFALPKKTGGQRIISAPMPRLKAAQHWILSQVLEKLAPHASAHGFRAGRSTMSNAVPHVGSDVVINLDLKDFFPTVAYPRVKGLFRSFGYSEALATIFGLLCTEPAVETVELDGRAWTVALGPRFLPQGAPTSPAITNLICRRLDEGLVAHAERLGFTYTRYADDLTFSGSGEAKHKTGRLLGLVSAEVVDAGFQVHPDKTRVLRRGRRQEVTGIVVNDRPNVDRETLRRFRATLFQLEKDGLSGKRWGDSDNVLAAIQGFASYVWMVNPEKGAAFRAQVRRIVAKYGPATPATPASALAPDASALVPDASVVTPASALAPEPARTGETASAAATGTDSPAPAGTDAAPTGTEAGGAVGGPAGKKWWKLFGGE